jgi:hypothetical protein
VFYNTHHKRNSFDNQGGTIASTVHFYVGYQNAFWNGVQVVYGDNMAADDVVGHEISHGVTEYSSNLIYYGQSGAINESFSDVWGEFVDQTNGAGNDTTAVKWLMGEDTALGVIRSMSNPPAYGNPDKMSSPYFYTGSYDNGGVHINSGVNNKAAYLLVEGGIFNGRYITAIGMNKTAAVYYEAQANLLTAGANYSDLYYALLQACQNLTGGADGITATDCLQVQLAAEAVEMISVPVPTPTAPPTDTFTPTTSLTPSATPTFTRVYTPTRTFTPSPTFTKTRTPTATKKTGPTKPTSTPTLKSTAVPSRTPRKSSFADVPSGYVYFDDIEILYANGLTGGCSNNPLNFCPDQIMNRGQAAVFMLRGNFGNNFVPDQAAHIFQDDWSGGAWAESWAEAMRENGFSSGCLASPLKYCPWDQIPREQAVIFALRLKYGMDYQPPAATGTLFADMTDADYYATAWAEQAYRDGLIPSCGTSGSKPLICPRALVSRGLAAYMIVRAKSLTMP